MQSLTNVDMYGHGHGRRQKEVKNTQTDGTGRVGGRTDPWTDPDGPGRVRTDPDGSGRTRTDRQPAGRIWTDADGRTVGRMDGRMDGQTDGPA